MKSHFIPANSRRSATGFLATTIVIALAPMALAGEATLVGRAVLPAETFAKGPTSGTLLGPGPINGIKLPFTNKQPVQGVSAVVPLPNGAILALCDNGFGKIENSADFLLRLYTLKPSFKTADAPGAGGVELLSFVNLSDPDRKIPWTIVHHFTAERLLTGADLDPESMQRAPDGTLWIGDEFGPFLLHFAADGRLLEAPFPLPDLDQPGREIRAPENPFRQQSSALRLMNAVRAHARAHGNLRTPVCSPSAALVKAFDVPLLRRAGFPVVVWTVNDKAKMLELMKLGVDGIISDRPDLLFEAVQDFDADGDGKPGDFLDADGLVRIEKFDAQGHRGGRNLRPESTLPAMEVCLDSLMTTLELDCAITADGVPVVRHDSDVEVFCARRVDGKPYTKANRTFINKITVGELQSTFIADKLLPNQPAQKNDLELSPVSVAYAEAKKLPHPYAIPTLDQIFDFVDFYVAFYQRGAGRSHVDAAKRAKNASRVRYNIETKLDPAAEAKGETVGPAAFADAVAGVVVHRGMAERADVQSFDFRTLLHLQEKHPAIRTVYLFDPSTLVTPPGGKRPWHADMPWPRARDDGYPPRAKSSGGFEGLAIAPNGKSLYPMLEKPVADAPVGALFVHVFDLEKKTYGSERWTYPLDPKAVSIGDFQFADDRTAVVIERDDSQGDLGGFKRIFAATLEPASKAFRKTLLCDLLSIRDPMRISLDSNANDSVGLGERFAFPFWTIESALPAGERRLLVASDNNFPFGLGRRAKAGKPDDSEFILLELEGPIAGAAAPLKESP